MSRPKEFFTQLDEQSVLPAWGFSVIFSVIFAILSAVPIFLMAGVDFATAGFTIGAGLITIVFSFIAMLISPFIGAAITHLFLLFFNLKGGYTQTFQVLMYAAAPSYLVTIIFYIVNAIPVVGRIGALAVYPFLIAASIYSAYLQIVGLAKVHDISYLKAATPLIIGFALGLIFLVLMIIAVIVLGAGLFGSSIL